MNNKSLTTTCCIAGGGPAGMMTGLLLSRAGIDTIVLEKHADFFRDFRGDTIHPSTFQLIAELRMLNEFLAIPHQEVAELGVMFDDRFLRIADFSHLPVDKPALGLMPQWDFLNFLQQKATQYKSFRLMMNANVSELLKENGKVTGVKIETNDGITEVHAQLVIAADGRHSILREKAGLKPIRYGVPIDVLWFKLSKQVGDPLQSLGYFHEGKLMVLLERNEYWQCGYVIAKGGFEKIREKSLRSFGEEILKAVPFFKDRVNELKDWEQIKLLTVLVDHLEKWYCDGFVCIGDAAHAMSPVGGVGINLALQDAVAAANILYPYFEKGIAVDISVLKKIQKRRAFPTRLTQRLQLALQNGIISRRLQGKKQRPPLLMRIFDKWKWSRRLPARLIGIGIRPEHIKTPEVF